MEGVVVGLLVFQFFFLIVNCVLSVRIENRFKERFEIRNKTGVTNLKFIDKIRDRYSCYFPIDYVNTVGLTGGQYNFIKNVVYVNVEYKGSDSIAPLFITLHELGHARDTVKGSNAKVHTVLLNIRRLVKIATLVAFLGLTFTMEATSLILYLTVFTIQTLFDIYVVCTELRATGWAIRVMERNNFEREDLDWSRGFGVLCVMSYVTSMLSGCVYTLIEVCTTGTSK